MPIAQSCVLSGTHVTTQFPSHGLGEPVAYGFQTLAKGAALQCSCRHYEILPPRGLMQLHPKGVILISFKILGGGDMETPPVLKRVT